MSQSFKMKFKMLQGFWGSIWASFTPLEMIQSMASKVPNKSAVSGTSNRVFTVQGATYPFTLWINNYPLRITQDLAYTWVVGENEILSSTGAIASQTNGALGIWYMYVGINSAGVIKIYPSQTAPKYSGLAKGGQLTHPGTALVHEVAYVGFVICDATTPTFKEVTKRGFTYHMAVSSVATTATLSELAFTGAKALPSHEGVTVGGYMETGAAGTVQISGSPTADEGVLLCAAATGDVQKFPFDNLELSLAGKIWAIDTVARGDVHVTRIHDVV